MLAEAVAKVSDAIYTDQSQTYSGPYPSSTVQYESYAIYFQFDKQCESKLHWTNELLKLRMQPAAPDGFKLIISEDKVMPGVKTIRVTGDAWID